MARRSKKPLGEQLVRAPAHERSALAPAIHSWFTRAMKGQTVDPVQALLTDVREVALALPGAQEYVMVHHPAFRVGKKPFAIVGMDSHVRGATLSINFGRELQHQLLDDARFNKTPYLGQHGWVTIAARALATGELSALIQESWRRVASKKQQAARTGSGVAKK